MYQNTLWNLSTFDHLEPKTQNGIRNDQKALGFPLKVDGVLRLREMLKSIGPRAFWSIAKVDQHSLSNLLKFDHSGPQNAKWLPK